MRGIVSSGLRVLTIISMLLVIVGAAPALAATGPISWWKADGNTLDSVGPENGTAQGGLTYAPGVHGQAFNFNGTDAAVTLPSTTCQRIRIPGASPVG